jgi:hypothetical protein
MLNEVNQIHNFMSSSGSETVINYGSGSDFLTSCGSGSGSSSTRQKVTVPTVPVPVPQHCWNAGIPNIEEGKTLETGWGGVTGLWRAVNQQISILWKW